MPPRVCAAEGLCRAPGLGGATSPDLTWLRDLPLASPSLSRGPLAGPFLRALVRWANLGCLLSARSGNIAHHITPGRAGASQPPQPSGQREGHCEGHLNEDRPLPSPGCAFLGPSKRVSSLALLFPPGLLPQRQQQHCPSRLPCRGLSPPARSQPGYSAFILLMFMEYLLCIRQ